MIQLVTIIICTGHTRFDRALIAAMNCKTKQAKMTETIKRSFIQNEQILKKPYNLISIEN